MAKRAANPNGSVTVFSAAPTTKPLSFTAEAWPNAPPKVPISMTCPLCQAVGTVVSEIIPYHDFDYDHNHLDLIALKEFLGPLPNCAH
jgi:hypothetical protein